MIMGPLRYAVDLPSLRVVKATGKLGSKLLFCVLLWLAVTSALQAQQAPTVVWPTPAPIAYPTPLSDVQLNAAAYVGPSAPVALSSFYNVTGITTDGYAYNTGGFDGSSWAWSAELLGSSISWKGISFALGPANAPDAVYGATIPLPAGNFGSILVLGDLVNDEQPPTATFIVRYTDGSLTTIAQNMSDWVNPRNYPGESLVKCVPTRHNLDGSTDPNSVCVYGYQFAVDPTRTVASIALPADRDVVILSLVALPPSVPGTFTYNASSGSVLSPGQHTVTSQFLPSTSAFSAVTTTTGLLVEPANPEITPTITWPVPASIPIGTALSATQLDASAAAGVAPVMIPLAPYYRVNALYADGSVFKETGVDGSGDAFSANQLGTSLEYAGYKFALGPLGVPDSITSSTIALPAGSYSDLYLLGAGANGPQLAQKVTVNYVDGTSTSTLLNLSSWTNPQHFADETVVATTTLADTESGAQIGGTFDVYGYQIALDPTRAVSSLTLPANTNVIFLAAGISTGTTFPVPGTFVYAPPAGTVPTTSLRLTTNFTPSDTLDFTSALASTQLTVGILDFTLQPVNGTVMTAVTGQSPSLAFLLSPTQNRYGAPITFSLLGTIPPLASVSFSPTSVGVNGGSTMITLTITTRKLSGALVPFSPTKVAGAFLCSLVLLPLSLWKRRLRITRLLGCAALLVLVGSIAGGCGSGYADHVYPLTIEATDGVTTHSMPIELHIEASPQ
jgi:hypothetical protein